MPAEQKTLWSVLGEFWSHNRRMRTTATHWLHLAEKVFHYRRDQLTKAELTELQKRTGELRAQLQQGADAGRLKLTVEAIEPVLRRTGGKIYPKSDVAEWVEFFLVAGIVLIGLRTYFVSPFQIPTNSMWPSYYGMTAEVYSAGSEKPGPLKQAARFIVLGARHYEVAAPRAGDVTMNFRDATPDCTIMRGHKWLILPATLHEYTFFVGGEAVPIDVPEDFDSEFRKALIKAFFHGDEKAFFDAVEQSEEKEGAGYISLKLGRAAHAGEPVFSIDILAGDMLFVDRFSYHFIRPKVGEGFVFHTRNIPFIGKDDYFIKRLVGVPGDTLQVRQPVLYRNGRPITGAASFQKEAQQSDHYPGYRNEGSLGAGLAVTVPPENFFAMGDNSPNSFDGRYWGFVPAKEVVGRPLFVYYPFTSRWGPAH